MEKKQEHKLERTLEQLQTKTKVLRKQIKHARYNVADLEFLLQQQIKRSKTFAWYYWVLLVLHLGVFLQAYTHKRTVLFGVHLFLFLWLYKRIYAPISGYATLCSMCGLLFSFPFFR
jgi:cytochrome c biogenesis protein ResB